MYIISIKKSKAFSLLELLTVIVIVSIVMSYATPSMQGFYIRQKLSNSANTMIVDLVFMRTAAIEYGHPITMLSNDGNNWSNGWKIFIDKNKDSIVDVDEEVLRLNGNIGDGIIISANVSSFVYNNLGGIDGVLPEIDVSHDDSSYGVTLMVLRSGVTTSKEKS